ncbi:MAG: AMMECR1 domain-containing protein, partial [Rectinema sp.]|nr:AMMECR1 domain-containing protein [Rectinema sp.]
MFSIDREDRQKLLAYARNVIMARMGMIDEPMPPALNTGLTCGAFVTLRKQGQLRGCIGRMHSDTSLAETIAEMARAAAFEDPRFPPCL